MKHQLIQKLLALIIAIFSISGLFAQCKGNKILYCYYTRTRWVCECRPPHGNSLVNNTNPSGPFSSSAITSTTISLELTKPQNVSLKIYDGTGRLIKTLAAGKMPEGEHQIEWNKRDEEGNRVSAGMYTLRIDSGVYSGTKKFAVI